MATLTSPLQALLQGRGPRGGRDGGIGPGKPVRAHRECCTMTVRPPWGAGFCIGLFGALCQVAEVGSEGGWVALGALDWKARPSPPPAPFTVPPLCWILGRGRSAAIWPPQDPID